MREAFAFFDGWTEGSDDDAIELTIVFLKAGGYLLGIVPEFERRIARQRPPAFVDLHAMIGCWIKPMDTTQPAVLQLRDYRRRLIAPFILDAVVMPRGLLPAAAKNLLRPIPGIRPLLKF